MDTSNWVFIILTMNADNEPEVQMATQDERKAHEFFQSLSEKNPMFFIKELDNDQA